MVLTVQELLDDVVLKLREIEGCSRPWSSYSVFLAFKAVRMQAEAVAERYRLENPPSVKGSSGGGGLPPQGDDRHRYG